MAAIRAFIAIEIPERAQKELIKIGEAFKPHIARASWVKLGNIHLTLKFLGDVRVEMIESISEALGEVAAEFSPFMISFSEVGAFPSPRRPRVLWVGVGEGGDETRRLAGEVERAMAKLGFKREDRPFVPHLTLARIKSPSNLAERLASFKMPPIAPVKVGGFSLIRSQLDPKGAIYTRLREFKLSKI